MILPIDRRAGRVLQQALAVAARSAVLTRDEAVEGDFQAYPRKKERRCVRDFRICRQKNGRKR